MYSIHIFVYLLWIWWVLIEWQCKPSGISPEWYCTFYVRSSVNTSNVIASRAGRYDCMRTHKVKQSKGIPGKKCWWQDCICRVVLRVYVRLVDKHDRTSKDAIQPRHVNTNGAIHLIAVAIYYILLTCSPLVLYLHIISNVICFYASQSVSIDDRVF